MRKELTVLNFLRLILFLAVILLMSLLAGCGQQNDYVEPPPPPVTVAQPLQQEVTDYLEFTGTTAAVASVDVRARVKGFLESIHFTPATQVKAGDLLFVIDPKPFQAQLEAAKAQLESARANLMKAESDYARLKEAGEKGAVTERDVVAAQADRDAAKAAVEAAQAAVTEAELDLGYTQVTAPISGRVGRNLVDVGNLVGDKESTLLTTITQYDPIYAYFNMNERDLLRVLAMSRRQVANKELDSSTESSLKEAEIPLYLGLTDQEDYPYEGQLDFAESGLDTGTGTLQLRGVFPNPGDPPALLPGLFARLRLPVDTQENALLVAEQALGADQSGKYLLVVNKQNVVEKRLIETGQVINGLQVIAKGVRPDDWVIVNGIQRARPGGKVNPERTEMASLTAAASATQSDEPVSKEQPPANQVTAEDKPAGTETTAAANQAAKP
jgi:RND family efflux transporter MFP subunit